MVTTRLSRQGVQSTDALALRSRKTRSVPVPPNAAKRPSDDAEIASTTRKRQRKVTIPCPARNERRINDFANAMVMHDTEDLVSSQDEKPLPNRQTGEDSVQRPQQKTAHSSHELDFRADFVPVALESADLALGKVDRHEPRARGSHPQRMKKMKSTQDRSSNFPISSTRLGEAPRLHMHFDEVDGNEDGVLAVLRDGDNFAVENNGISTSQPTKEMLDESSDDDDDAPEVFDTHAVAKSLQYLRLESKQGKRRGRKRTPWRVIERESTSLHESIAAHAEAEAASTAGGDNAPVENDGNAPASAHDDSVDLPDLLPQHLLDSLSEKTTTGRLVHAVAAETHAANSRSKRTKNANRALHHLKKTQKSRPKDILRGDIIYRPLIRPSVLSPGRQLPPKSSPRSRLIKENMLARGKDRTQMVWGGRKGVFCGS